MKYYFLTASIVFMVVYLILVFETGLGFQDPFERVVVKMLDFSFAHICLGIYAILYKLDRKRND